MPGLPTDLRRHLSGLEELALEVRLCCCNSCSTCSYAVVIFTPTRHLGLRKPHGAPVGHNAVQSHR